MTQAYFQHKLNCINATIKKEFVAKSETNDYEKKPGEESEKKNQLAENAETNTLKNDQPKANNQRQSPSSATNSDEAPSKLKQEIENVEMTIIIANNKQHSRSYRGV
ncbi:hypothetical protein Ddc_09151 [Ditylenchus destructor]|nr:hypothetical protein Ddc_09151 [Ditylenchus destructor]